MKQIILTAACAVFLAAGGCAATAECTRNEAAETQIISSANLGDSLLHGLQNKDYKEFSRMFTAELKERVRENAFGKVCSDIETKSGRMTSWTLIDTACRADIFQVEIWKVRIQDMKNDGKSSDCLFLVTTAEADGHRRVIGFRFDPLF